MSYEESKSFGEKYYSTWLQDFQLEGKHRHTYELSDLNYEVIKESKGKEYADRFRHEVSVYKAFSYYCGGNYGLAINELCRKGYTDIGFNTHTLKSMIQIMESEINKFVIKENIIGYRTLCYKDLLFAQRKSNLRKGDIIIDQGFMGVGLVKETLLQEHDMDTLMKVFIPTGSHAIYLDLISNRPNEQELLLKKNTKLKILSIKKLFFRNTRLMHCAVI